VGVLAIDGLLCRRGSTRSDSRNRSGNRNRHHRVLVDGWRPHSAVLGRAMASKVIMTSQDIRMHAKSGWSCFGGCASILRQRRILQRARTGRRGEIADAGTLAGRCGGARHQRGRLRRRYSRRIGRDVARAGYRVLLAELKDPVKDKLKRFGLFSQLGEQYFFPTIGAAVSSYLEINDVEWEDWKDQAER